MMMVLLLFSLSSHVLSFTFFLSRKEGIADLGMRWNLGLGQVSLRRDGF